jgi:hypothetical protein
VQSLAAVLSALVLAGSIAASTMGVASASVILPDEHWRYNVHWYWDTNERETVGLITPIIVIENETSDRLEGYVADANGTRLDMYDGDQVVKVRYGYDGAALSKWELAAWINDGYFSIEIPQKHRDADFVRMYIGNNDYSVDDGDVNTKNAWVTINSANLEHRLDSTLVSVAEESPADAVVQRPAGATPMAGSLIDLILSRLGMI